MLREPRPVQTPVRPSSEPRIKRFQIVKLEERIAPACHFNEKAGKYVGCGKDGGPTK